MKRDAEFIKSQLYVKNGKIYTKSKTIIEFPKWMQDKKLADLKETSYVYGIFTIIIGEKYSVSTIPTLCSTIPVMTQEVEKQGETYVQLVYGKDDCLFDNVKVVKEELLSYNFFEAFFMYAKIPWYIEYVDLLRIMDNLPKYAKSRVGENHLSNELLVGFITRLKKDKTQFYRQGSGEYEYVDLMSPYYSMTSTTAKISGGYFQQGLTSAIVQKEKSPTKLETLVR